MVWGRTKCKAPLAGQFALSDKPIAKAISATSAGRSGLFTSALTRPRASQHCFESLVGFCYLKRSEITNFTTEAIATKTSKIVKKPA